MFALGIFNLVALKIGIYVEIVDFFNGKPFFWLHRNVRM